MPHVDFRVPLAQRPPYIRDGEPAFWLPKNLVEKNDEMALGMLLLCHRPLFGECYLHLAGSYFWSMPRDSGVFATGFVPSTHLLNDMAFPGDIDLLVIPYEGDELVVSRTLSIELKVVRASFKNQGKSPDRYGFSQAQSLLDHGFPYAAVAHLIVSDGSPEDAWGEVGVARIVDADTGEVELVGSTKADILPVNLTHRSFGRLRANRENEAIGIVSVYFTGRRAEYPMGVAAQPNPAASPDTLRAISEFYQANYAMFIDIPRHDP